MLNAEKYKDEIKTIIEQALEIKEKGAVNCKINSLTGVGCGNHAGCNDCKLKALIWLLEECKEPILTDEGKSYLLNLLKPYGLSAHAFAFYFSKSINSKEIYWLNIVDSVGLI